MREDTVLLSAVKDVKWHTMHGSSCLKKYEMKQKK